MALDKVQALDLKNVYSEENKENLHEDLFDWDSAVSRNKTDNSSNIMDEDQDDEDNFEVNNYNPNINYNNYNNYNPNQNNNYNPNFNLAADKKPPFAANPKQVPPKNIRRASSGPALSNQSGATPVIAAPVSKPTKSKICVAVRKRPLNQQEILRGDTDILEYVNDYTLNVHEPKFVLSSVFKKKLHINLYLQN